MNRSSGISGFVATLMLVTITLTLSYVVYEGVGRFTPPKEDVFANQAVTLGGYPMIVQYEINTSSPGVPLAFEADDAGSPAGIFFFNGTAYGTTQQLCLPNATTFFSVYTSTAGLLQASANGRVWIDGNFGGSLGVAPGWHEIMITGASSCRVAGPDGSLLLFPSRDVSTVPFMGSTGSRSFTVCVPTDGLRHSLVMAFDGGYDRLA